MKRSHSEVDTALPFDVIENLQSASLDFAPARSISLESIHDRHLVQFHYPCLGFLPAGQMPLIDPLRREPQPRWTGHEDFDTTSFHFFDGNTYVPYSGSKYDALAGLMEMMRLLRGTPGKTDVGIVRFWNAKGIITRIVVNADFDGGPSIGGTTFDLDERQWRDLFSASQPGDWIVLTRDLVYRESDRAFYHVQDRVTDFVRSASQVTPAAQELLRLVSSPRAHSTKEILFSYLRDPAPFKIEELELIGFEFGSRLVRLPCGCLNRIKMQWLETMTESDRVLYRCRYCGFSLLPPNNRLSQALTDDHHRAHLNATTLTPDTSISIKAAKLFEALHAVLTSFDPLYTSLIETEAILSQLDKFLHGGQFTLIGTIEPVLENLMNQASNATIRGTKLSDVRTAPGLHSFAKALLLRAITFALQEVTGRRVETRVCLLGWMKFSLTRVR